MKTIDKVKLAKEASIQLAACGTELKNRALEAIAYQRKLLTNCQIVPKDYFNEGQLQIFNSPGSINIE